MMQKRNSQNTKKNTSHHSWYAYFGFCFWKVSVLKDLEFGFRFFLYVNSMHFTDISMNLFLICLFVFSSLCLNICSSHCLRRIDMDNNKWTMAHLWARIWRWLYGASFELSRHSSILVRTQFVEGTRRNCAYVSRTLPANTKRYVNLSAFISMWENILRTFVFLNRCVTKVMRRVFFSFRSLSLSLCQILIALLLTFSARIAIALYDL